MRVIDNGELMHQNWKNKDDYPLGKNTHEFDWALQFLFRNKKFLAEWKQSLEDGGPNWFMRLPDRNWAETKTGEVLIKYGVSHPRYLPFYMHFGDEFAAYFPSPPFKIKDFDGVNDLKFPIELAKGKRFYLREALPNTMAFEFDLSQPILPQIKSAQADMVRQQNILFGKKRIGKNRPYLFHFYLRVLDAVDAKASNKEICEVLSKDYPKGVDESLLEKWKKTALRLCEDGYKDIAKKTNRKL